LNNNKIGYAIINEKKSKHYSPNIIEDQIKYIKNNKNKLKYKQIRDKKISNQMIEEINLKKFN